MSSHPIQNQAIPFPTIPMDQQANFIPSSMNNLPSNSQFNYPQHHSAASINYNQEPIQLSSQKQIIEEEQVEELQKVSFERNQIDQDEILRMFREEENRMERNKKSNQKKKPLNQQNHSQQNKDKHSQQNKDKKPTAHQLSKKQPAPTEELFNKRKQAHQQSLPFIAKTTSFKQIKSQSQPNSPYFTILNSQPIRELLLQYKIQYRSSVYDPEWQKERYKLREGLFQQFCVGVEEMKQKPQGEVSMDEQQLLHKLKQISSQVIRTPYDFGVFKYCRNLVIELDLQLFMHFHLKSRQPLSKDYKAQYKTLLNNLKDPQNYQLRQKILCKKMDADMLKVANEIQLLTESKRNQIKEKEQKLLKEFSVDHERTMLKPEFENDKEEQRVIQSISYGPQLTSQHQYTTSDKQQLFNPKDSLNSFDNKEDVSDNQFFSIPSLLAVNKYIEESTLTQLEELLSDGQMQRMRIRLDEDLKGECRARMLKRFDSLVLSKV